MKLKSAFVILVLLAGLCIISSRQVYAQEQKGDSLIVTIIKALFGFDTENEEFKQDMDYINEVQRGLTASPTPAVTTDPSISPSPGENPNIPSTGSSDNVAAWGRQLTNRLDIGQMGTYCRHVSVLTSSGYTSTTRQCLNNGVSNTGKYWCTNLAIDSENLAGRRGLTNSRHQAVVNMVAFWKSAGDRVYLDYGNASTASKKTILSSVKPGCMMFQMSNPGVHTGSEHVAVIDSVSVDASGNGQVKTLDSNGSRKSYSFPISGYQIRNNFYKHVSFGCYK